MWVYKHAHGVHVHTDKHVNTYTGTHTPVYAYTGAHTLVCMNECKPKQTVVRVHMHIAMLQGDIG